MNKIDLLFDSVHLFTTDFSDIQNSSVSLTPIKL